MAYRRNATSAARHFELYSFIFDPEIDSKPVNLKTMTKSVLLILAGAAFAFASCQKKPAETSDAAQADITGAPVETQKANSDYKPAFAGQTRIGSVKSATPYEGKVLNSDLKNPWGIT